MNSLNDKKILAINIAVAIYFFALFMYSLHSYKLNLANVFAELLTIPFIIGHIMIFCLVLYRLFNRSFSLPLFISLLSSISVTVGMIWMN